MWRKVNVPISFVFYNLNFGLYFSVLKYLGLPFSLVSKEPSFCLNVS